MNEEKNVIIIGAGLSGLTAANQILISDPTINVKVLQAMNRVGGRTLSVKLQGAMYDLGAQWIGPKQHHAKQLAQKSKTEFIPQFCEGRKIMDLNKKIETYTSDIPINIGILGLVQTQLSMWKIQRMAKTVPMSDPSKCQNAILWDSMTIHTWIMKNIWLEKVRILIQVAVRAIFGAQTNQISFLFFLWYTNQSGGFQPMVNIKNGLQQKKLLHGTQHMSHYLKQQIQKKNGEVILQSFVKHIQNLQNKCIVTTEKGQKYQADYVIIALPPTNVQKISFTPDLSLDRKLICRKNCLGSSAKAIFLYQRPYWRQKGFSGETLSDCFDSPVFNAYDDTRLKQNGQLQYGIIVFINGAVCRQWMPRSDCQKKIKQKLSHYFNSKEMLNPIRVQFKDWQSQPSIGGSPIAFYPPGSLTQIKNLRKPEGRIHWAGTQMATISQGYMDGAIQSGKRVADEIMQKIKEPGVNYNILLQQKEKQHYWYTKIVKVKSKFFQWWY